jgi:hypothetical protein
MSNWPTSPSAEELQAVRQLSPHAVRTYLTNAGWRPHEAVRQSALWTLTDGSDEFEVMLPTDPQLRDFPLRMFDLLRTLAVVEDRPVSTVITDLINTSSDTITVRLLPDGPPGTIPLFNGADALQGVRELVMAATYATTLPRPLLVQGRRPTAVRDFARRVRLGTPQAGSWVIAAELALPETDLGPSADGGRPFARQVSLQMHQGVRATLTAAGEALRGSPVEPFLRRADEGVSANLCDALADLGRDDTPFEVRFAWAQRLPARVGTGRFRFDRQVIRVIRYAGEAMRNSLPDGPIELTGMVTRLSRAGTELATAVINAVVRSRYGEAEQKVTVRLLPGPHETAIEAYRTRQFLHVVGEARQGRIDYVEHIEVVPRQRPDRDRPPDRREPDQRRNGDGSPE